MRKNVEIKTKALWTIENTILVKPNEDVQYLNYWDITLESMIWCNNFKFINKFIYLCFSFTLLSNML